MEVVLLIVHVLICIVLIVSILLQSGKGSGLAGSAFGGGAGGAMFGGAGAATFLGKVTMYTAVVFALTCVGLWYTSRSGEEVPETAAERMMGGAQQQPTPLQQIQPQPLTETEEAAPAETTTPTPADSEK